MKEIHPDGIDLIDYAILGYNYTIYSSTNYTLVERAFGHTSLKSVNEMLMPDSFYNKYFENCKEKLKHVYKNVYVNLETKNQKIINTNNSNSNESEEIRVDQIS